MADRMTAAGLEVAGGVAFGRAAAYAYRQLHLSETTSRASEEGVR